MTPLRKLILGLSAAAALVLGWWLLTADDRVGVVTVGGGPGAAQQEDPARTDGVADASAPKAQGSGREVLDVPDEGAGGKDEKAAVPLDPRRLEGRVVRQADGEAVPGAKVELLHRDADEFWNLDLAYGKRVETLAETTTGEDGRFGFDVARGRQHRLRATKEGYAPRTALRAFGGAEVVIELGAGATVFGRVSDKADGRPVAGAEVKVSVRGESATLGTTESGPDGTYRLEGLPAETVYVQCTAAGFGEQVWNKLDIEPGKEHRVDLELDKGRLLIGTVTDATTGKPVPGASVARSWTFRDDVLTDGAGRYALAVSERSGYVALHVRAEGYVEQVEPIAVGVERLDVVLRRGGSVKGRVVDGSGAAIAGAYVAAGASYTARQGIGNTDWIRAEVDRNGFFEADGLDPMHVYSLYMRAPGRGTKVYILPRRLAAGEVLDVGDLRLLAAGGVEGRVVDDEGQPVAGMEVSLAGHNADADRLLQGTTAAPLGEGRDNRHVYQFEMRDSRSAADGSFRFTGVAAGTYELRINRRGGDPIELSGVEVRDGEVTEGLVLRLVVGLTIEGRVVRADGQPLPKDTWMMVMANGPGQYQQGEYRSDGTFRFESMKEGLVTVSVLKPPEGFAARPARNVAAGAKDVEIVLVRAAEVSGKVVDADGKPVAGAFVSAMAKGGPSQALVHRTDAEGRFSIEVLPDFVGRITVSMPNQPMRQGHADDVPAGRQDIEVVLK
ncbi:MAG: carboxypeptidase regulatory-like domain-containing protein [Planctomycetota bacterium]